MKVKKLIELLEKLNQDENIIFVSQDESRVISGVLDVKIIRVNPDNSEWTVHLFEEEMPENSYLTIAIVTE